ncbi:MAG TPA: GDSL-type esterase/lipase family protein, partial [Rhizomicrobium sp.]
MRRGFKALLNTVLLAVMAVTGPAAGVGTAVAAQPVKILALGTSLTQGYGLPPGTEFTVQLQAALKRDGIDATVTNAGVSGDTTAGGLSRLDWSLADHPDAVILELGSNDMLRG